MVGLTSEYRSWTLFCEALGVCWKTCCSRQGQPWCSQEPAASPATGSAHAGRRARRTPVCNLAAPREAAPRRATLARRAAQVLYGALAESSWRTLLFWLGPPGLVVPGLAVLTLDEPRKPAGGFLGNAFASSKFTNPATRALNRSGTDRFAQARISAGAAGAAPGAGAAK